MIKNYNLTNLEYESPINAAEKNKLRREKTLIGFGTIVSDANTNSP